MIMHTYQYELVDPKCRSSINLAEHAKDIAHAFYFVQFQISDLRFYRDRFKFSVQSPLTPADARSMGRHIASCAKKLAQAATRVYNQKKSQDPKFAQSKQLFKRRK
ncbi:hypothetical protein Rmet_2665 [Cupriavidus metallidurans CH34]|uniref:Uncharacterized protein n=1 Tax=Cupriavidus metallidurans (strain ATCC 43123 / DSM 2839 / NBRC 102507 / CH34) TaxID=266264 RepID=Q1LJY8_CUPMC|nr:hypothetical protein Rmet_2665 [Cupriavidus metallidurans CH34]